MVFLYPHAVIQLMTRRKRMVNFHAPIPVVHRTLTPRHPVVIEPGELRIWDQGDNPAGHGADPIGGNNVPRKWISYKPALPVRTRSLRIINHDRDPGSSFCRV